MQNLNSDRLEQLFTEFEMIRDQMEEAYERGDVELFKRLRDQLVVTADDIEAVQKSAPSPCAVSDFHSLQ